MDQEQQARVLVADDSATVRALVRLELEAAGYAVVEAEDGQQALEAARAGGLRAVLLDVEMPVLDGHATIAELKRDSRTAEVPVVFPTSRGTSEDVVEALRLGAHDYLRKPPEPAELLARVAAAIRVSGLREELRRRTEDLDRMSRTDHLTGLYNRRHLDESLQADVASSRRHAFPISVLLVDVDHFKSVNDVHGHEAGDAVLQAVAGALRTAVRTDDLVGRWGGEEFLVLARHTDAAGAQVLGDRLRAAVSALSVPVAAGSVSMTISVGGATAVGPAAGADAVLRVADAQLYEAKAAGRDRARVAALAGSGDDAGPAQQG